MPNLFSAASEAAIAHYTVKPEPNTDHVVDASWHANQAAFARIRPQWAKPPASPYRSEGIRGHMERAAARMGLKDRSVFGLIEQVKFVKNIQQSLTVLSEHHDERGRQEIADRMELMRLALAVALSGVNEAIQEAVQKLGLTLPPFSVDIPEPFTVVEPVPLSVEPAPSCQPPYDDPEEEETDEHPGQLCGPQLDRELGDVCEPTERGTPRAPGTPVRGKSRAGKSYHGRHR